MRRLAVAGIAIMVLMACGESADQSEYRLVTIGSLLHAENIGIGSWDADQRWVATVSMTLGVFDGEGPEVFGSVSALALDSLGNLHVLDGQAQEVRVFNQEGAHVLTLGGPGAGPGELGRAAGLNIAHDGGLWIWDPGNRRFTIFDRTRAFNRTIPRRVNGVIYPWRGEFDSAGAMIDWGLDFPDMDFNTGDAGRRSIIYPVRVDPHTGAVDTLPEFRFEGPRVPYRPLLTTVMDIEGQVWFALTDQYRIFRRTLAGDTTFAISLLDARPEPVTGAERDSIARIYGDGPAELPPIPLNEMPEYKPILIRLLDNRAGHLLVMPQLAGHPAGTALDVFEKESGRYLGRVELPVVLENNPAPVAAKGVLYGMIRGEFDVPQVVQISLKPPALRQP